jgi:hypothetical protein
MTWNRTRKMSVLYYMCKKRGVLILHLLVQYAIRFWDCSVGIVLLFHFIALFEYAIKLVPIIQEPSWSWSYDSWIYNYLCNQCHSSLMLWVRIPFRRGVLDTTICDKVCQSLAAGRWFSPGTPVSSINKTYCHDITEILLKVAINTIALTQLSKFVLLSSNEYNNSDIQ